MDRKDKRLVKEIVVADIIIVIISIFLWIRYNVHIGIIVSIILLWASFISIRIITNKHGIYSLGYKSSSTRDKIIRKLMRLWWYKRYNNLTIKFGRSE